MKQGEIAARLGEMDTRLATIAELLQARVPPPLIRAAIEEGAEAAERVGDLADAAPLQAEQLTEIVRWLRARMSGDALQAQLHDLLFATQQLTSVSEQWRTDLLQMRTDIRRLAGLCEQVLRSRVDDEENGIMWRAGEPDRRNSIADRRRA